MTRQHISADRQRAHRAGQRNIVHYCDCGLAPRGNAAWWSHSTAHPDHHPVTLTQWHALGFGR
jgi:hypothetical protein